jgi:hypothetical protein
LRSLSSRALDLGKPNFVGGVRRMKLRIRLQQIPRVTCRPLIEHVGQDVPSLVR